jgi:hypothetical protein
MGQQGGNTDEPIGKRIRKGSRRCEKEKSDERLRFEALAALDTAARHRRLDNAFEELRDTMIRSFRTIWRDGASHSRPGCSEAERRETAVQEIKEFMDFRPLESFPAERLEFLALVIGYWREIEVEGPQEVPGPDPIQ